MKDMQKMNMKNGALLGICVGAAALIAAACGTESNNPGPGPAASTTGPVGTSVVPTGSTTGPAPVITPTGPTGGTTGPAPTSSATGGTGNTVPTVPMSDCINLEYARDNELFAATAFPGVRVVYGYGDGKTSLCSGSATAPAMLCVEGNAVSSAAEDDSNDYLYYGAGVGLQLAEATDGVAEAPFDAAALGIASVKFTVSNVAGRIVRIQMSQVNEADKVYQDNNFVRGGTEYAPNEIKIGDMEELTVPLADFKLPPWAADTLALPEDTVLDATKIYALAFQIANTPSDDTELYSFCIGNLQWLDAAGNPVTVTIPEPNGTGGDTSGDTGSGDTSAPAGSGSGETSAPVSSGEETSGPATLDFATQIQPILTAKCGSAEIGCHMNARPPELPSFASGEPDAAAAAEMKTAVSPGAPRPMPPAGATALTEDERALLIQWADSK